MPLPRSIAVRTAYRHHSAGSGYRQVLRATSPIATFGVDERAATRPSRIIARYPWLVEWQVARAVRALAPDVVHVLYGEEYYRFLHRLAPHVPIVVTYHQPPDGLARELHRGDLMGRVYRAAHLLNRARFRRASACIVMTAGQAAVLEEAVPVERIHVVPLGVDAGGLARRAAGRTVRRAPTRLLTVGQWMRDWDFFARFAEQCAATRPDWELTVVNRQLPERDASRLAGFPNVRVVRGASDDELLDLYLGSSVQFLPVTSAAGNNAVNEGLALGCPVVSNVLETPLLHGDRVARTFRTGCTESALAACDAFVGGDEAARAEVAELAARSARELDWSVIGRRTLDVYHAAIARPSGG